MEVLIYFFSVKNKFQVNGYYIVCAARVHDDGRPCVLVIMILCYTTFVSVRRIVQLAFE